MSEKELLEIIEEQDAKIRDLEERLELERFFQGQKEAFRLIDELGDSALADEVYIPGCGQDDTRDSRGRKLRPKVNDAGEPWWM